MISEMELEEEDAMKIASLTIVAFCAAASSVLAVGEKAHSRSVCRPDLTANYGPLLDTFVQEPRYGVEQRRYAHHL
jgi:hypothetical protein